MVKNKSQRRVRQEARKAAELARKQRNSKLFWRSCLGLVAAGFVGAGVYFGLTNKTQDASDYGNVIPAEIGFEQAVAEASGTYKSGKGYEIIRENNARDVNIEELETITKNDLEGILEKSRKKFNINIDFTKTIVYYQDISESFELLDSKQKKEVEKLLPVIKDIIESGLDFWKHPELKTPDYSFVFPKDIKKLTENESSFEKNQNIDISAIHRIKYDYKGKIIYHPTDSLSTFAFSKTIRGESQRTYRIMVNEEKGLDVYYFRSPIIWAKDTNLVAMLETPSVELLHLQMSVFTEKATGEEFKASLDKKKYKGLEEIADNYSQIQQKYNICEEYFVHGLHRLFFEQYVKEHPELNINLETLDKDMGWNRPKVHKATEKIKKFGVQNSINEYIKDPTLVLK